MGTLKFWNTPGQQLLKAKNSRTVSPLKRNDREAIIWRCSHQGRKKKITQTFDGQGLWGPCIKKQLKILKHSWPAALKRQEFQNGKSAEATEKQ